MQRGEDGAVISLVVPTRNRAHTLARVASSFFGQDEVVELIFVLDATEDDTRSVLERIGAQFPEKRLVILENPARLGAARARNLGVALSHQPFVLFCDDDEYLEQGYAAVCRAKLMAYGAAAVSGRRIYLQPGESLEQARHRFGQGLRRTPAFRQLLCEYVNGACFEGDLVVPLTNAVILTRRDLLRRFPFDEFYARGNGYREESDFQMNLFVHGYNVVVSNAVHSFHLPLSEVRTGGQRSRPLARLYWSVFYTRYFFDKYYRRYAARLGLRTPKVLALAAFAVFAAYREALRPVLYPLVLAWYARRRRTVPA